MENFYTVDQVSGILDMHPKTIRRYIREGKIKASKVGKNYRISGHELSVFTGGQETISQISSDEKGVKVSTVVDLDHITTDQAQRISNLLLASINHKDKKYGNTSLQCQFIQSENKLRVMIWGNLKFTQIILESIEMLVEDTYVNL